MRAGIARRTGEVFVEILLPGRDLHPELRRTRCFVEGRRLTARIAINGDELTPRDRASGVRASELPNVIAAVAATTHDDDGAEVEWLAGNAHSAVRYGCAVRHRHEGSPL